MLFTCPGDIKSTQKAFATITDWTTKVSLVPPHAPSLCIFQTINLLPRVCLARFPTSMPLPMMLSVPRMPLTLLLLNKHLQTSRPTTNQYNLPLVPGEYVFLSLDACGQLSLPTLHTGLHSQQVLPKVHSAHDFLPTAQWLPAKVCLLGALINMGELSFSSPRTGWCISLSIVLLRYTET